MNAPLARSAGVGTPAAAAPADLVERVMATTGLTAATAARVVSDVTGYFGETMEGFVRRRHAELRARHTNDEIWQLIAAELAGRPVRAPVVSARQLRRIVYG